MDAAISALLNALLTGGNRAVVALLVFICYGLWLDRARLIKQQQESRDRLAVVALAQTKNANSILSAITDLRLPGAPR